MISLQGRTVLVTGVTSGLGAGLFRVLARYGATVVGCARRAEQGVAHADALRSEGHDATFVQADIGVEADRLRLVEAALARNGTLHVLVNNAGMLGELALIEATPLEQWEQVLAVNLTSAFALARHVLPVMRRQHDGVILNVSSINAVVGITHMAAYDSAKAGLAHLARVIAAEAFDDNVRANAIILGGVRSEMTERLTGLLLERSTGQATPERVAAAQARRMDPDDVARALALLCLPEARVITGSEITIDQAVTAGRGISGILHGAHAATA